MLYSKSTTCGTFSQMFISQPLLCLHELPNSNRNVFEQIRLESRAPVRFTATAIVIHADHRMFRPFLPFPKHQARSLCTLRRMSLPSILFQTLLVPKILICFPSRCSPFFHIISVYVPDTVHAATHATIIRFFWPWRNPYTRDQRTLPLNICPSLCWTSYSRTKDYFRLCYRFLSRRHPSGCWRWWRCRLPGRRCDLWKRLRE